MDCKAGQSMKFKMNSKPIDDHEFKAQGKGQSRKKAKRREVGKGMRGNVGATQWSAGLNVMKL